MTAKHKIRFYFRALVLSYPYFRVTYRDGGMTKPLTLSEAIHLLAINGGTIWTDKDLMRDI